MAGLLVSLFSGSGDSFSKIRESFKRNEFLKPSFELNEESLKVVKYMRFLDEKDSNYCSGDNFIILCVGTITYGDSPLERVLCSIFDDLKNGMKVEELCSKIDGSFCLVIYEKDNNKLHIITDGVGLLHTYYYKNGKVHVVSTSELALARSLCVTPSVQSIAQFMRASYILDEDTFFGEIKCLEPGTHYLFDLESQRVTKKKYHRFPTEIDRSISFDEATGMLTSAMDDIISLFPKDKTLVDFTGGNDSRSIMSYVYRDGQDKMNISALFSGPPESYEYRLIKKTCSELGIKFYDFLPGEEFESDFYGYILTSHELGSGEENAASHAPILWSNQNKRRHGFLYSMHGSGGELYRDARWDQEFGRRGKPKPADLKRLINWRVFQYEYDSSIYSDEFLNYINDVPDLFLKSYESIVSSIDPKKGTNTLQLDTIYLMQNMRKWGGGTISSTNQIIASVCPFLFTRPLEIALSVNPDYRKGGKLNKFIAEKIAPELARKKMQTGSPFVAWKIGRVNLFIPFYIFLLKKLVRKLSQVIFHRTVFSRVTLHDFDLLPRFKETLETPACMKLLDYDGMKTKSLYNREAFYDFLRKAKEPGFKHYKILGNMMTLELTMRQANLTEPINFET